MSRPAGRAPAGRLHSSHATEEISMTGATVGSRSDESSLVARLSLEQKVRLLTGADGWPLHAEPAVGLRPLVVSDGPAGVRGTRFDPTDPATSLPCPIALAAT